MAAQHLTREEAQLLDILRNKKRQKKGWYDMVEEARFARKRCQNCDASIFEPHKFTCNKCVSKARNNLTIDPEYGAYYTSGKCGQGYTLR